MCSDHFFSNVDLGDMISPISLPGNFNSTKFLYLVKYNSQNIWKQKTKNCAHSKLTCEGHALFISKTLINLISIRIRTKPKSCSFFSSTSHTLLCNRLLWKQIFPIIEHFAHFLGILSRNCHMRSFWNFGIQLSKQHDITEPFFFNLPDNYEKLSGFHKKKKRKFKIFPRMLFTLNNPRLKFF